MNRDTRKRLLLYLKPCRLLLAGGALFAIAATSLETKQLTLLMPFLSALQEVTSGIRQGSGNLGGMVSGAGGAHTWSEIKHVALVFLLIQVPKGLANYGYVYWVSASTNRLATKLREDIYSHIQKLSLSYFERSRIGHILSRIANDVGVVQNSAATVIDILTAPMTVLVFMGLMLYISWKLTIVVVLFVPAMGWVINRITRRMRRLSLDFQVKLADLFAVIEETIAGVRIVKSFGMEDREVERFRKHNVSSLRAALRAARRNALVTPVTELVGSLAVVAIILAGGWLVNTGEMTMGGLLVFGGAGFYVNSAAKKIGRLNATYHQTMASVERIFAVLDEQPDIEDVPGACELGEIEGRVEFRDVSFSYQTGEQVLNHVSFSMEPGKVVAVVGPSGAGKSTIANLIPRFYDVSDGAVMVEGSDVREVTAASLRRHIGIVPQETILFSGSIRDNIAYGRPDASDVEVEDAAKAANAHEFIMQFEHGYQTIIGERGARLSGGERQRISIARALLKDPRILILDEATSSLDAASERLVQEALDRLMRGRTTLVIAHRLSTITSADRIIVLANGRIVEQGSFESLTEQNGFFARLYNTQYDLDDVSTDVPAGGLVEADLGDGQL